MACYDTRDFGAASPADANIAGSGGAPAIAGTRSSDFGGLQVPKSAPPANAPAGAPAPPKPRPPKRDAGSGGVSGGSGECLAFRTPENDGIWIDQDAFSGIGGAGAELAGTCKRCGWSSYGDLCQELVAIVPTIQNPNYYPCLELSLQFAMCLEVERCVCGGDIPPKCAAIRVQQDACLANVGEADGGI